MEHNFIYMQEIVYDFIDSCKYHKHSGQKVRAMTRVLFVLGQFVAFKMWIVHLSLHVYMNLL